MTLLQRSRAGKVNDIECPIWSGIDTMASPPPLDPMVDAAPRNVCSLPLRLELDAVRRILDALHPAGHACLDIGFRTAQAGARLRAGGGYWTSVALTQADRDRLAIEQQPDVLVMDAQGELPFEDKQFDVVVVALGSLTGARESDTTLIRECHRVMKAPGYLILTVEYAKPFGLAFLLNRRQQLPGTGARYSESDLFDLLKTGFDWLGMRQFCRFWMQMVWQWTERHRLDPASGQRLEWLYWLARVLDYPGFLARGYLVTVYGRRKGWRPRQTPTLSDGRSMPEAVLHRLSR